MVNNMRGGCISTSTAKPLIARNTASNAVGVVYATVAVSQASISIRTSDFCPYMKMDGQTW